MHRSGQVPVFYRELDNIHRFHYPQLWWSLTETDLIIETSYTVGPFTDIPDAPLGTSVSLDMNGVISKIRIPLNLLTLDFVNKFPVVCTMI